MATHLSDLPRVVAPAATSKVEHPHRVFGALVVAAHDLMPLAAVRAADLRAEGERRIAIHATERSRAG